MDIPKIALLCVLVAGIALPQFVTAFAAEQTTAAKAEADGALEVARSGSDVLITWTLPAGDFKQIEIYRNTNNGAPGRTRAAAVRNEPRTYMDKVPDLTVTYWYWLKLTRTTGQIVNIGPVPTPTPTVWQP